MTICTPTKRARILALRDTRFHKPMSFRKIGSILGLPRNTVYQNWKSVTKTGDCYAYKTRPGRPRKFSERDARHAEIALANGSARDATDVQRQLFPDVSSRTVQRRLEDIGLHGRVRRKKPYLSPLNVKQRKVFIAGTGDWDIEKWRLIVFSDESKFNLFGSDGRQYCRRRVGEAFLARNVKKAVAHGGGSLMVWGCITAKGVGRLHRINGNLNAPKYCAILEESLLSTLHAHSLSPHSIILQHDNDTKHRSRLAKAWLDEHCILLLPWPSSSPDLNIIENVWEELDRHLRHRHQLPRNLNELWIALQEEWYALDTEFIRKLYDSIPDRIAAVKHVHGLYTRY